MFGLHLLIHLFDNGIAMVSPELLESMFRPRPSMLSYMTSHKEGSNRAKLHKSPVKILQSSSHVVALSPFFNHEQKLFIYYHTTVSKVNIGILENSESDNIATQRLDVAEAWHRKQCVLR